MIELDESTMDTPHVLYIKVTWFSQVTDHHHSQLFGQIGLLWISAHVAVRKEFEKFHV